jgi:hypothetical protein
MIDEHVISPELALVDPALASRLRAAHVPPCTVERQRRRPATRLAAAPDIALAASPAVVVPPMVAPAVVVPPMAAPAVVVPPMVAPAVAVPRVVAPTVATAAEAPPAPTGRSRRLRLRPLELVSAAALVVLLGAAFLPSPNPPTFAAPVEHGEIVLAWPELRKSDIYILQILGGSKKVYERRLEEPHLDEVFALVDGRRYTWRVYVASGGTATGSKPIARGSFVLGG